ncbi:hypothetical protein [Gordonia sp. NPDC003376]
MTARRIMVVVLVTLTAVLSIGSVTAGYVRAVLLDSDTYVSVVGPLATDPAVQHAVSEAVIDEIDSHVDYQDITNSMLDELAQLTPGERPRLASVATAAAPAIASRMQDFIRSSVEKFVASDRFAAAWSNTNRRAHEALVALLTGQARREAVEIGPNGEVAISLDPILVAVRTRLLDQGLSLAQHIPTSTGRQLVLVHSSGLAKAQRATRILNTAAWVLPWIAIGCAAAAVALAGRGRRWSTTAAIGAAVMVAMLILAIALLITRTVLIDQIPPSVGSGAAARVVLDAVLGPLRFALRAVAAVGLVLAVVGFVAGGSSAARRLRAGGGRALDALVRRGGGHVPDAWARWVSDNRRVLQVLVVVVGALTVVFWTSPSALVVLLVAVLVALVLAVVEVIGRSVQGFPTAESAEPIPAESESVHSTPAGDEVTEKVETSVGETEPPTSD